MGHSYYEFYYHIIWATKYRDAIITPQIEKLLIGFIPKKIIELGGRILALNMVEDHLHLLAIIPPRISVSEVVNKIKGGSSFFVNKNLGPALLDWQKGFGALTVSGRGVPYIKKYIENQKVKHNSKLDLLDILERID